LLGLISSYTQYDARGDHINGDMFRVGGEGEYFFERITLGVNAGYQGQDVDDGGFGGGDVRFYPTDFLLLAAGVQAGDRTTVANLDAEFLPGFHSLPGMSVFGNFGFGDNDYEQVLFGIRYYFGKRKSLIRRHREDDPRNPSVRDIGPNLREYQQKRDRLIASGQTQPPPLQ
ncbi:MAG: hypothetical protein ACE5GO_11510, partial [Anaerolineales bacterium]